MTSSLKYTRDDFVACEWRYDVSPDERYGYSTVMRSLQKCAKEKLETGHKEQAELLELLARAVSMMLAPHSINEPFKPIFQDFQAGRRSAIPDDFTAEELNFFESILNDVDEPWLKARLADLLWLCKKPKNPEHAKVAISFYIGHSIDPDTWRSGIDDCWERGSRLAMQIRDFDKLTEIKTQLFTAFGIEYPGSVFMSFWLANLLHKLKMDRDYLEYIAPRLFRLGSNLKSNGELSAARSYFEAAAKKYQQNSEEQGWLDCLAMIAESFEQEAGLRSPVSNMLANSFYENAIQAYRRIPIRNRDAYSIDNKIQSIRRKMAVTGQASLDEMELLTSPSVDISDMVKTSIAHVAGKRSLAEALIYFAGVYPGPQFKKLEAHARESMQENPLSGLFASNHMSRDGRVVAKTPPADLCGNEYSSANQAVLHRQIQQHFGLEVQLVVKGQILPALRQLLMEHRVTKDFLEEICCHSPIIPRNRFQLLGYALWLGFEYDFGNAIHLLCPQLENIVRVQLKLADVSTTNIDREGIENENGLSTLMVLPEATKIFGEDLVFEIKSVFTDAVGFKLRNEVAHGLLDDDASNSIHAIYAWWMMLRLVIRSM